MYTVIQYYFIEFNMDQKVKYTNKVGVTSWQHFGQIKSGRQYRKLKICTFYNLIIVRTFLFAFKTKISILEK